MEDPQALRMRMVTRLVGAGVVVTPSVEDAMRRVPRHRFLSATHAGSAYVDEAVTVKRGDDGSPLSSASQPTMVALMLEHLQVAGGHHVLEVGTGTGYNAALLSVLAGPDGSVVSIELEPDLARAARRVLDEVTNQPVDVVIGDGRDGYLPGAPYDRVIVTAGATEVAPSWIAQLAAGGRLVVPIVDRRGAGTVIVFEDTNGQLVRRAGTGCRFLPIRPAPTS